MTALELAPDALDDPTQAAGLLISRDPFIAWGPNQPAWRAGPGSSLARHVGNRRAYFLFSISSTREWIGAIDGDAAAIEALRREYPEHRHVMLCNTRREVELAAERGIDAILCSTLALANETIFDIQPREMKRFDAIYTATLSRIKRHELCRDLTSLALIYHWYFDGMTTQEEIEAAYKSMLPRATFVNGFRHSYRLLDSRGVTKWVNRAHVGLCLSAAEGAMGAAIEYLLCGVPVVTTPSIGGRDRVFTAENSMTVEPTPEAVADAVRTLALRNVDPYRLRNEAGAALKPDRVRLLRLIAAIYEKENVPFPDQADWLQLFRHSPWPQKTVGRFLSETPIAERSAVR
ncbi:MAG: glycosyltransferase family 4 protein [Dongiaceae bacterium]